MKWAEMFEQTLDALDEVKRLVAKGDDEGAHGAEDDLQVLVLEFIQEGTDLTPENVRLLASLALRTKKLEFARWCA